MTAISRALCMDSMGLPTSTVRMPSCPAVIGPIVLPQPRSVRVTKCCGVTPASRHSVVKNAHVSPSVAYDWLTLDLMTGPRPICGWCFGSCSDA